MHHVIVGTAGHIDHGKSALVLALTGTDPDRWEEEKRRGITIDLGFAHLDLGAELRVGFIDVPGHERFVKNMLAGVGGIDLVMLVVAADESIKPQTREHFDICRLLGIERGLVVITKRDLVDPEVLELVRLEVQDFVAGSFLANAPAVAVSARTGEGLDELRGELRRLSMEAPSRSLNLPFRLPIDRSFVMKGFGAVVTGTLIAGSVQKETEVEIFPLGRRVRVRGIEVHNAPADRAFAGQRTALNLAGINAHEITRGMVLAEPGLFQPTTTLDCTLNLLPSARPLKSHAQVHFHCGTAEMLAQVVLLDGKQLESGASGFVQLRLAEPGLFAPGDRFIIRQFSPVTTIGGGSVLDNAPAKHRAGDASVLHSLRVLAKGDPESRLELLAALTGESAIPALANRTGWSITEVLRVAKSLETEKRLIGVGQPPALLVHPEYFARLSKSILERLREFHAAEPLSSGLPKEELRAKLAAGAAPALRAAVAGLKPGAISGMRKRNGSWEGRGAPSAVVFNALLQALAKEGKLDVAGESVRLAGHTIQLSPEEADARRQIAAAFEKAGLAVPSAPEVLANLHLDKGRAEKLLRLLVKENVLVKVTEELIFHQSALRELRQVLRQRKAQNPRLTVLEFKNLTGLSRKYAIPLLEYLDRERVTSRQGADRVIL